MSRKYSDRIKRRIRIREKFLRTHAGRHSVSRDYSDRQLAHAWRKAGDESFAKGEFVRALAYYRKALEYRPAKWDMTARLGWARARVTAEAVRRSFVEAVYRRAG